MFDESAFGWVRESYDRAAQIYAPGGITLQGWDKITDFWLGLRASLGQVKFTADHLIHREDPREPERLALRWTVTGQQADMENQEATHFIFWDSVTQNYAEERFYANGFC
ncbi:MAG: hypothetical protein VW876_08055 [Deltaproteobacteria bacterium]